MRLKEAIKFCCRKLPIKYVAESFFHWYISVSQLGLGSE
jgi:hypothetical protein